MRVILDNILIIEKTEEEKKTESGFLLPTEKVDWSKPLKATVVAVGGNVKEVNVGDEVYYLPKTGDSIVEDGVNYRVFRESNIIAVS